LEDDYENDDIETDIEDEDYEDGDDDVEEDAEVEEEAPKAKVSKKAAPTKAAGAATANGGDAEDPDGEDDPIADLLFDIMDLMGIEAEIEFEEREDHVRYHIEVPELGVLIGRHGQTLEALQFLIGVINARRNLVDYRVVIDVEGYRERREKQLRELARRSAQRASREGRKIVLAPMPAVDRRVIHMALADHADVKTYSEGEEPDRRVVVIPGDHE